MAATFDPTLANPLDRLRLALGDVDVSDATAVVFADETYLALIAANASEDAALLAAARAAYALLANQPTEFKDGDASIEWANRLAAISALVERLTIAEDVEGGAFDIAEVVTTSWGVGERLYGELLRDSA